MNDFAAGLPSPLAFLGLGDAIARYLGLAPWCARTLPVLHKVEPSRGRTKAEMERDKPRSQKSAHFQFLPIEIVEDLTGYVEVSLLLDLPGCDDDLAVGKAIEGRRIAGGAFQDDCLQVLEVTPDGSAFGKLQRGFAMIRSETECHVISTGEQDSLSQIAELLFSEERTSDSGWIVPVAVGHRLLEDPDIVTTRIWSRNPNVPHVFTEPVLGIAELVSIRNKRLTGLTEEGLNSLLWSWKANDDYVVGHAAYHPRNRIK